ncbi:hypothetical protein ACC717_38110, partial [Rhizobium ruizarguesonis]
YAALTVGLAKQERRKAHIDGMPPSWRPNQRHLMRRDCLKAELGRRYALAEKRLQITLGVATMKGSNPEKMSGSLHLVR